MVPRKNKHNNTKEATFQVGYRGLISLAFRSGKVKTFAAHVVHANDHFQYSLGTSPIIEHLPVLRDRGEIVAVYALVLQKDGENDCEVMSREDIESHRNKYCEKKAEQYDPWQTAWEEMAKKTVIRRLAKRVPMSVEMTKASVLDEYGEVGVQQELPQVGGVFPAKFIGSSSQQADAAQEKLNPKSSPQPAADREPGAESEGPYAEGF
jgi:recombination protein RecT